MGEKMNIMGNRVKADSRETGADAKADENRPVKLVQEKKNIWRIVYAD